MMDFRRISTLLPIRSRAIAAALALAAALPAGAQEWSWDAYGIDSYDGAVTLTDDTGASFTATTDPTSVISPSTATSAQPPVIIVQQAGGGVMTLAPPSTTCDASTAYQVRYNELNGQEVCHLYDASGVTAWYWAPIGGGAITLPAGTVMSDGTVFTGSSGVYTTPSDSSGSAQYGCLGTGTGATSTTNGESNTAVLVPLGCNAEAARICGNLTAYGHTDWYLPSKDELNAVLFVNRVAIGGFGSGNYWSSTENNSWTAWYQSFSSGAQGWNYGKDGPFSVRCIRK